MNILLQIAEAPAVKQAATIDSLFTVTTLGTLAGATGAVYVICGTVQSAFNFSPRWLALVVSIAISYVGVIFTSSDHNIAKYFIALLNGCLIYTTATGANTLIAPKAQQVPKTGAGPAGAKVGLGKSNKRTFNANWWHV